MPTAAYSKRTICEKLGSTPTGISYAVIHPSHYRFLINETWSALKFVIRLKDRKNA